jgi:hypothetical protein
MLPGRRPILIARQILAELIAEFKGRKATGSPAC